ncbi:MAG TPA: N-acetylmuramoyl-L-alanine amidase [Chloroflexota bacterium]|nr:N-acetylmuramoyl-L-alanine amidase [Chloroflexota bacterium]
MSLHMRLMRRHLPHRPAITWYYAASMSDQIRHLVAGTCLFVLLVPAARLHQTLAAPSPPARGVAPFISAARQSGVPVSVLVALAWEQSRDTNFSGPSIDDGYGPLDLSARPDHDTLRMAAALLHVPARLLRSNARLNILGGALLLARDERTLVDGRLPRDPGAWTGALVTFTGMRSSFAARLLLDDLFTSLRQGIYVHSGLLARVPNAEPRWPELRHTQLLSGPGTETAGPPDYPQAQWVPANYNNFTDATRPKNHPIRYIVIHDTEGSCAATVNEFQDPSAQASAHYLVCLDGTVIQMVHDRDIAWHAGNWPINVEAIGIEHEGYWGKADYTRAQYLASAALVHYLTGKYHLSPNRNVVFGHENVPAANHIDPGPTWNWPFYMDEVTGSTQAKTGVTGIAAITMETVLRTCPHLTCSAVGSANWGEEFAVVGESPGWEEVDYSGSPAWVPAGRTAAGSGMIVTLAVNATLRAGPKATDAVMVSVPAGQRYVSQTLDHGYYYVYFNHRYGFVAVSAARVVHCPAPHPAHPGPAPCVTVPNQRASVVPSGAPPGTTITVGGAHLAPSSPVTISLGGTPVGTAETNRGGDVAGSFLLPPATPSGVAVITLSDSAGHTITGHLAVEAPVVAHPVVTLPSTPTAPGTTLSVSGTGFLPLSAAVVSVTISLPGNQSTTVTSLTPTQPDGSLQPAPLALPSGTLPGQYQVTVSDGLVSAGTPLTVGLEPTPAPEPTNSASPTPVG